MNYRGFLTPWRYKVGRGWLMFIKAAAMRSPCFHPPTNVFSLYSSFCEEIKKKQSRPLFFLAIFTPFVLWRDWIRENPPFCVAKTFRLLLKIGFISTFFWERNPLHRNLAHFSTQIFKKNLFFFFLTYFSFSQSLQLFNNYRYNEAVIGPLVQQLQLRHFRIWRR